MGPKQLFRPFSYFAAETQTSRGLSSKTIQPTERIEHFYVKWRWDHFDFKIWDRPMVWSLIFPIQHMSLNSLAKIWLIILWKELQHQLMVYSGFYPLVN